MSLNAEETHLLLTLFAQEIGIELSNWVENQKSLGLLETPVDDPQWGIAAINPINPMKSVRVATPTSDRERSALPTSQEVSSPSRTSLMGGCFKAFESIRSHQEAPVLLTVADREAANIALKSRASACKNCVLGGQRRDILWGYGPCDASILFVAAGGNPAELEAGRIMPGAAAELLDKIVNAMAGLHEEARPDRIYMTNIIKCACIPAKKDVREVARRCLPYLRHEVKIVSPKIIVVWGELAFRTMTGSDALISQARGSFFNFEGVPAMATHHPMEMIKNPQLKARVWNDLKLVVDKLSEKCPPSGATRAS